MRIRNSYTVSSVRNIFSNNAQQGVYIATVDFDPSERNIDYDRYTKKAHLQTVEDQIGGNGSGAIGSDDVYPLDVTGLRLLGSAAEPDESFVGALAPYGTRLLSRVLRNDTRILLTPESVE